MLKNLLVLITIIVLVNLIRRLAYDNDNANYLKHNNYFYYDNLYYNDHVHLVNTFFVALLSMSFAAFSLYYVYEDIGVIFFFIGVSLTIFYNIYKLNKIFKLRKT